MVLNNMVLEKELYDIYMIAREHTWNVYGGLIEKHSLSLGELHANPDYIKAVEAERVACAAWYKVWVELPDD